MADKQYRVKFQCPNFILQCNSKVVEEVMVKVTQFSPITDIADFLDGSAGIDYGPPSHENGKIVHYACLKCGYVLCSKPDGIPITDLMELLEWLRKHNMLEEIL